VTALVLLAVGVVLVLSGVFALTFDEGGGDAYVTFADHRFDAQLAGAVSLAIGVVVIATSVLLLRRRRLRA
jgi:hypothetical protein